MLNSKSNSRSNFYLYFLVNLPLDFFLSSFLNLPLNFFWNFFLNFLWYETALCGPQKKGLTARSGCGPLSLSRRRTPV